MKKFWKKYKSAILTSAVLVAGLKIGSKYHEPIQKGFDGVSSAGKATGAAVIGGAEKAYNCVTGLFSKKTTENEQV